MHRVVLLSSFFALAACNGGGDADAGEDLGGAYCLGGGFPACTDRGSVPVCDPGTCAVCSSGPTPLVLCGSPTLILEDGGTRTRCLADPLTSPEATCTPVDAGP